MFFAKVPVAVAMVSTLPLYVVTIQFAISLVGLYEFTAVHGLRSSWLSPLWMLFAYLPYQGLLGYAALRAVWRQLNRVNTWEKTAHIGAHRKELTSASTRSIEVEGLDRD